MRTIRVAGLQLRPGGVENTVNRALRLLESAGKREVEVACLPEAWPHTTPYLELEAATEAYDAIVSSLSRVAREYGMWIAAGGLYKQDGDALKIVCPIISDSGDVVGEQEKVHLFRVERQLFQRGQKLNVFNIAGVKTGILICHDIVYPEAARVLAIKGAELILHPSRIVSEGVGVWRQYVKVRSVENRIPIVAANIYLRRLFGGGSIITGLRQSRRGVVYPISLASVGAGEKLMVADMELDAIAGAREERLANRLPSAYMELISA
ncbi:MAG: carbon-nitrogen hydrolase family protein [Aigarchaeota archaeon]|nr:carbon-nitrogen hydrolase family protein [Candidatus Pelearchaeum maunauluense]